MLPVPNLDDENYQEISKRAKKMIATFFPEWTDYNEHDPGITFLELFSWMKEMQQFHLNQIGKENYKKYLRLLGCSRKESCGAKAYICLPEVKEDFYLPKGSVAYAGEIPFETMEPELVASANIVQAISVRGDNLVIFQNTKEWQEGKMTFMPFGQKPEPENQFIIDFDSPLKKHQTHTLFFQVFDDYPVKRNLIHGESFYPLAVFAYEYYDGMDWKEMSIQTDETYQFLQSGMLRFVLPGDMGEDRDSGCYRIRVRILSCEYEVPPVLQGVNLNMIPVQQQKTRIESYSGIAKRVEAGRYLLKVPTSLGTYGEHVAYVENVNGSYRQIHIEGMKRNTSSFSECYIYNEESEEEALKIKLISFLKNDGELLFLGKGDGFPFQSFELQAENVDYSNLELMIEEETDSNSYYIWKRVEDFDASGAEDRHYVVDEEHGILQFGDCFHGLAPEGTIYVTSLTQSLGVKGNVMAKRIDCLNVGEQNIPVFNMDSASGGCDMESMDDCFERFHMRTASLNRAVTYEDYERIVATTPGLRISKVKAIPVTLMKRNDGSIDENCVNLVVEAYSMGNMKKLSKSYYENIRNTLERVRMIGSKFHILSPEYIGISIIAEVTVSIQYSNPREHLKLAVEQYVKNELNDFGCTVLYSSIYGILDTLECVVSVNSLTIEGHGRGINRSMNGDMILPANGLVYLREMEFSITTRE